MKYQDSGISFFLQNNKYIFSNIVLLVILYLVTLVIIFNISKKNNYKYRNVFLLLLVYHTSMSIFFYYWQPWPPTDAGKYFGIAINTNNLLELFSTPSQYVSLFLYPFVKILNISYFSSFMIFNIIGYFGLIIFFMALEEQIRGNIKAEKLLTYILFIPGMSYWTCSISKESINIFGISLILYSLIDLRKRARYLVLGLILILPLRPHIFLMILFSLTFALLLTKNLSFSKKFAIVLLLIIMIIPGFQLFKKTTQLEKVDLATAEQYMDARSGAWTGGSSVDLQNYNVVMRFFTFLYRPFFFDAHSLYMIIASFENLIYLIITIQMLSLKFIRFVMKEKSIFIWFNIIYFITAAFFLSYTEGNLGTAVRHKILVMISLLSLYVIYKSRDAALVGQVTSRNKFYPVSKKRMLVNKNIKFGRRVLG